MKEERARWKVGGRMSCLYGFLELRQTRSSALVLTERGGADALTR